MGAKIRNSGSSAAEIADDSITEAEIERSLAKRRSELRTKLSEAKKSIDSGDIEPLEPLTTLLRVARRTAKPSH